MGRFVQSDPVIPQNQGVQAWDHYAYVSNNPVFGIDPSGNNEDCSLYDFQCKEQVKNEEAPVDSGIIPPIISTRPDDPLHFDPPASTSTLTDPTQLQTPNMPDEVQPPETVQQPNGPNWGKFAAGMLLGGVVITADIVIVVSIPAFPEVDALLVIDAVCEGIPLTSGLIYLHVEAWRLISDGINGK